MAGISPATEAGRTSDRTLTCAAGWSLADRQGCMPWGPIRSPLEGRQSGRPPWPRPETKAVVRKTRRLSHVGSRLRCGNPPSARTDGRRRIGRNPAEATLEAPVLPANWRSRRQPSGPDDGLVAALGEERSVSPRRLPTSAPALHPRVGVDARTAPIERGCVAGRTRLRAQEYQRSADTLPGWQLTT